MTTTERAQRARGGRWAAPLAAVAAVRGAYWFALIKACRFLIWLGLPAAAEGLSQVTGLRRRLIALIEAPAAD